MQDTTITSRVITFLFGVASGTFLAWQAFKFDVKKKLFDDKLQLKTKICDAISDYEVAIKKLKFDEAAAKRLRYCANRIGNYQPFYATKIIKFFIMDWEVFVSQWDKVPVRARKTMRDNLKNSSKTVLLIADSLVKEETFTGQILHVFNKIKASIKKYSF